MFEIPRNEPSLNSRPAWLTRDNEKRIYDALLRRISDIERLIKVSEVPLKPSEYKIAKSVICKELGLSPSYIAKHSEINKWVDGHQRRLRRHASEIEAGERKRNYNSKKPEQMRKDALVVEVKKLRQELKEKNSELYVEQLNQLLNSGLAESQVVSQERIKHLEERIDQLQNLNAELEVKNQRLTENLVESIKELDRAGSKSIRSIK